MSKRTHRLPVFLPFLVFLALGLPTASAQCTIAGVIPSMAPVAQAGNTTGLPDQLPTTCVAQSAPDQIWTYVVPCDSDYTFSLCGTAAFDTILEVLSGDPCLGGASIACNDDNCGLQSQIGPLTLTAGTMLWIHVDGWGAGEEGPYTLDITHTGCIVPPAPWVINTASMPCVPPGGTIDITIDTDSGVVDQAAAQWRLFWDPAVFALDGGFGMGGIQFSGAWSGVPNTTVPGELYVASWHLPPYPVGVDQQATVRLIHIGGFGTLPVTGDVEIWADDMLADIIVPTPFAMDLLDVTIGCGPLPTCTINDPTSGQLITGTHNVMFDTVHPAGALIDIFYEFDAGMGWQPCSRVGGGPSMDLGVMAGPGMSFDWDLNTDFFLPDTGVDFRITVIDTMMVGNTCQVNVDVDIVNNPPMCTITSPAGGALVVGSQLITFDLSDADGNPSDILYEFDDGMGMGFQPASRVGGGSSMDTGVAPATGLTFDWDAGTDLGGMVVPGVAFRITCDDLRPMGTSTCSVTVDVRPPNNPPSCNIFFPGTGATLSGSQNMLFSTTDADGDPLDLVFEFDAGGGFLPATPTMGSALPNPALGIPPTGANSFEWDINADIFVTTMGVIFRISLDDGFGGLANCTKTWNIMVTPSPPSCAITAPMIGAQLGGIATVTFDALDAAADPLDITFEVDSGGGFMPATAGPGSPLPSPASAVTPAMGLTFDWDVDADVPVGTLGVVFRITVDDTRSAPGQCAIVVDVPPTSCAITSPTGGSLSGVVPVTFDALEASGDPLSIDFEVDLGAGFFPATPGPASPLPSPATGVTPGTGLVFDWDFDADVLMPQGGITFRITVSDGTSPAGTCSVSVSSCICGDCDQNMAGPDVLDSLAAAQIAAGIVAPTAAQMSCCDVDSDTDVDVIDSLLIAQTAAGLPVSIICP